MVELHWECMVGYCMVPYQTRLKGTNKEYASKNEYFSTKINTLLSLTAVCVASCQVMYQSFKRLGMVQEIFKTTIAVDDRMEHSSTDSTCNSSSDSYVLHDKLQNSKETIRILSTNEKGMPKAKDQQLQDMDGNICSQLQVQVEVGMIKKM